MKLYEVRINQPHYIDLLIILAENQPNAVILALQTIKSKNIEIEQIYVRFLCRENEIKKQNK